MRISDARASIGGETNKLLWMDGFGHSIICMRPYAVQRLSALGDQGLNLEQQIALSVITIKAIRIRRCGASALSSLIRILFEC